MGCGNNKIVFKSIYEYDENGESPALTYESSSIIIDVDSEKELNQQYENGEENIRIVRNYNGDLEVNAFFPSNKILNGSNGNFSKLKFNSSNWTGKYFNASCNKEIYISEIDSNKLYLYIIYNGRKSFEEGPIEKYNEQEIILYNMTIKRTENGLKITNVKNDGNSNLLNEIAEKEFEKE